MGQLLNHDALKATKSDIRVIGVTYKFCEKYIRHLIAMMIILEGLPFITVKEFDQLP